MSAGGQTNTSSFPPQLQRRGLSGSRFAALRQYRCFFLVCTLMAGAFTLVALATQRGVALDYASFRSLLTFMSILREAPRCRNFLDHATQGRWVALPMTPEDVKMMDEFHLVNFMTRSLNPYGQRKDERCGNVSFVADRAENRTPYHPLFRALCDPRGPRPCCQQGRCVNRSVEECGCEGCYDWRRQPHAEFARWEISDPNCRPLNFTGTQACRFLGNATLVFFGDSMIRDCYCSMLMLLREDRRFGALDPSTPEDIKRQCEGLKMFGLHICRPYTKRHDAVCGGRVKVHIFQYLSQNHIGQAVATLRQFLHNDSVFLMAGMGLHDQLNVSKGMAYIKALHEELHKVNASWPHLIWVTPNAPGLLRSDVIDPSIFAQNPAVFRQYHVETTRQITELGIPIMDTWALTAGAVSFDGTHVGLGINLQKSQILLTYIQQFLAKRSSHANVD